MDKLYYATITEDVDGKEICPDVLLRHGANEYDC